jgi:hypothetical protein
MRGCRDGLGRGPADVSFTKTPRVGCFSGCEQPRMAMRLTEEQLEWLAERVPDAPVSPKGGRPPMDKRDALA